MRASLQNAHYTTHTKQTQNEKLSRADLIDLQQAEHLPLCPSLPSAPRLRFRVLQYHPSHGSTLQYDFDARDSSP